MRPFNSFTWTVFAVYLGLTGMSANAAEMQTNQISLAECIQLAVQHNLDIQIARQDPRIAGYELKESYSIYDPVFEGSYIRSEVSVQEDFADGTPRSAFDQERDTYDVGLTGYLPTGLTYDMEFNTARSDEVFFDVGGTDRTEKDYDSFVGIELRQPLLDGFWIDDQRSLIKINKLGLENSRHFLESEVMRITFEVKTTYFELVAARDLVGARNIALELATQLFDENQKRVRAGTMTQLDAKQAESEKEIARAELIAANRQVRSLEIQLMGLLTDDYEEIRMTKLVPAEKLLAIPETFDALEAIVNALQKRPVLLQERNFLAMDEIRVKTTRNQLYPNLDLIGSYGRSGLQPRFGDSIRDIEREENPSHAVGVVLSFPLWNQGERNRYRRAKETRDRTQLEVERLRQQIMRQIDDSINVAEANFERITATRQARIFAEDALRAEQIRYDQGTSTSFLVLEAQSRLTEARQAEILALAEYNIALTTFYFNEGTILERNNIFFETP